MELDELNKHLDLIEKLHDVQEMYQNMEAKALGAQKITGMPHGTGVSDKVGLLATELADLSGRITYLREAIRESAGPIEEWVNTIEEDKTRMIFRLRFLHGYSWGEVAYYVGTGISEDTAKQVCYRYLKIIS